MQVIQFPEQSGWANFLKRPYIDNARVLATVQQVMDDVKARGDAALKQYAKQFDGVELDTFVVSENEVAAAEKAVPEPLKKAIQQAKQNIETFHRAQRLQPQFVE